MTRGEEPGKHSGDNMADGARASFIKPGTSRVFPLARPWLFAEDYNNSTSWLSGINVVVLVSYPSSTAIRLSGLLACVYRARITETVEWMMLWSDPVQIKEAQGLEVAMMTGKWETIFVVVNGGEKGNGTEGSWDGDETSDESWPCSWNPVVIIRDAVLACTGVCENMSKMLRDRKACLRQTEIYTSEWIDFPSVRVGIWLREKSTVTRLGLSSGFGRKKIASFLNPTRKQIQVSSPVVIEKIKVRPESRQRSLASAFPCLSKSQETNFTAMRRMFEFSVEISCILPSNIEVFRDDEGETRLNMEQHRNARAVQTGDPRENPSTSGIVRHDSHMYIFRDEPGGNRTRFALVEGE
ncbi:hypothetical protein PR048_025038 [Dryococelus australis]|uniref:Uncharacterized protein n=1 Tax=Dryococelus australis TaxID=614101 RepID=A0ABQ9GQA9_9NEOP|nr:hypothetical protein PR048_025038 [Dryococelus australis]